jgi:hydroxymethylglutaryl-CoA synthase
MAGIISYGGHIPWHRMNRMVIYAAMGFLNPATLTGGEKAIANYDEDSVTMAVNAGMNCLNGIDRNTVDGVYFASVTMPFKERQNAAIIATALDLRSDIQTADFAGSTKSGTTALLAACDAVKAGSAKSILVCASDCRLALPGSLQEETFGDGAAAFLIGENGVIADFRGAHSVSYDFRDTWRTDFEKFNRQWEDRWIRDEGYNKFIPEVVSGLAKKCNLSPKDVAKAAYPCLYAAAHPRLGKSLGLEPNQIQENMFATVGNTGSAYPLILLGAALEDANPRDNVVVASFGNGSDALLFQATEKLADTKDGGKGVKKLLESKKMLDNYAKYLTFRNVMEVDKGMGRGESTPWEQISLSWRYRRTLLGLVGSRCKKCGTPQFPYQMVCVNPNCNAIEEMEPYRFSDKKGHLFTYTADNLAFTYNPPAIYGMVDFEGGGRSWFDFTDCDLDDVKVDMLVGMSFRRKFVDEKRGNYGYFWKAVPVRE